MRFGVLGLGYEGLHLADALAARLQRLDGHEVEAAVTSHDRRTLRSVPDVVTENVVHLDALSRPDGERPTRASVRRTVTGTDVDRTFDRAFLSGQATPDLNLTAVDAVVVAFGFASEFGGGTADAVAEWARDRLDVPVLGAAMTPVDAEQRVVDAVRAMTPVIEALDHAWLVDNRAWAARLRAAGELADDAGLAAAHGAISSAFARRAVAVLAPVADARDLAVLLHGDVSSLALGTVGVDRPEVGLVSRLFGSADDPSERAARTRLDAAVETAVDDGPTIAADPTTAHDLVVSVLAPPEYCDAFAGCADRVRSAVVEHVAETCGAEVRADHVRVRFETVATDEVGVAIDYVDVRGIPRLLEIRETAADLDGRGRDAEPSSEEALRDL